MSIPTGTARVVAQPPPSAYQQIGGQSAVRQVVDRLYFQITRDDHLFLPYFQAVNIGALKAHMVALLSQTLGGPKTYTGRELGDAHAHLYITPEHYDRVERYLVAALLNEQADWAIIDAVRAVVAELKPVIVRKAAV